MTGNTVGNPEFGVFHNMSCLNKVHHKILDQSFGHSYMAASTTKMLLVSPAPTCRRARPQHQYSPAVPLPLRQRVRILSMAKESSDDNANGQLAQTAAIAGGLVSTPVIAWSLYTLKTTGCGLPPGPGGSIGALEGVSYLGVAGIVGWSLYTKSKTGSGLPNGPYGLLGAVEGFSYLSLVAILVVFGLQFIQQGSIPGPLPTDQCFG